MKSPLKVLSLLVLVIVGGRASALSAFECVRDLLPITSPTKFRAKRPGVEAPFLLSEKYLVFPEVAGGELSGFYIYTPGQAWYYDALSIAGAPALPLRNLHSDGQPVIYQMVAQAVGIETLTLLYLPGFAGNKALYRNPEDANSFELRKWVFDHSVPKPVSTTETQLVRQMGRLNTQHPKSEEQLWLPLGAELKMRKTWVQDNNLNEESFKVLNKVMQTSCHQPISLK